jgi:hypothetical protein
MSLYMQGQSHRPEQLLFCFALALLFCKGNKEALKHMGLIRIGDKCYVKFAVRLGAYLPGCLSGHLKDCGTFGAQRGTLEWSVTVMRTPSWEHDAYGASNLHITRSKRAASSGAPSNGHKDRRDVPRGRQNREGDDGIEVALMK